VANVAVTVLEPKTLKNSKWLRLTLGAIIGVFLLFALSVTVHGPDVSQKYANVYLGGEEFLMQVANTPKAREQGLSDTKRLNEKEGMIFSFDTPDPACFWMKDMEYNLDIIWLDANQRVLHIENDLSPSTYPNSYCSPEPATYVLEVNGATVKNLHVQLGDQITLVNR
jgi:uncharacterized membrane protein (UPF0127 family)